MNKLLEFLKSKGAVQVSKVIGPNGAFISYNLSDDSVKTIPIAKIDQENSRLNELFVKKLEPGVFLAFLNKSRDYDESIELRHRYSYEDLADDLRLKQDYYDLLQSKEWGVKRKEILERDNLTCQICFRSKETSKDLNLHVHHRLYIDKFLPWDYENQHLITLCAECHQNYHEHFVTPVFEINGSQLTRVSRRVCDRCNGVGYLWHYSHVEGGVCFKCEGSRVLDN